MKCVYHPYGGQVVRLFALLFDKKHLIFIKIKCVFFLFIKIIIFSVST